MSTLGKFVALLSTSLWMLGSGGPAIAQTSAAIGDVCYVASDTADSLFLADQTNGESLLVGPFLLANGDAVTSVEAIAFNSTTGVL